MKRLSLLFVAAVFVFALGFGTTAATPAGAADTAVVGSPIGNHHHYDVYYGTCEFDSHFYRSYDTLHEARHAASYLQEHGYWTQIRHG